MSEQEEVKAYNALITIEREKSIRIEPINFSTEEAIWIPKSQFQVETLEVRPWLLDKLGFGVPLHLQLPQGGWQAVEKQYATSQKGEGNEAKLEVEREALKGLGDGATVHDDNPANETIKDRDGEDHIMTLNEKLTEIKVEAIEDGLDAIQIERDVKRFAYIWRYIRLNDTFKKLTEIQRGYAASAIFKDLSKKEQELPPQEDDTNVVKVYQMPYMGGGLSNDKDNEEGPETLSETD